MSFSIVILSKNPDNLIPCVRAIRANEPGVSQERIVVVDDGARELASPELPGITWVTGKKPFVFARNANVGIAASAPNDVILLNDDALLETPHGFTGMWGMARNNPQYGLIASTCNNVGNTSQHPLLAFGGMVRDEPRMVCFVCVLIPRATIDQIGGLDEAFSAGYGVEDDDYSFRVRRAGLKIGIWDGCYVDHGSLRSTFRGDPKQPADFRPNLEVFKAKWGHDNFGRPA